MKASLDTNVLLHLYRADMQGVLFDFFDEDIYINEFIFDTELKNHGSDIKEKLDRDIAVGRIQIITEEWLRNRGLWALYHEYLNEETLLYSSSDRGEACAIALARVLGAMSVVTDDTKPCGPHHTLMCLPESDIIPFAHYELVILLYLMDRYSKEQVTQIITAICENSPDFNLELVPKIRQFLKRSIVSSYSEREHAWFESFANRHGIDIMAKSRALIAYINAR